MKILKQEDDIWWKREREEQRNDKEFPYQLMFMQQQQAQQQTDAILQHVGNTFKAAFPLSSNTASNVYTPNSIVTTSLLTMMNHSAVNSLSTTTTHETNKEQNS